MNVKGKGKANTRGAEEEVTPHLAGGGDFAEVPQEQVSLEGHGHFSTPACAHVLAVKTRPASPSPLSLTNTISAERFLPWGSLG